MAENNIPVIVFNMFHPGNITRALRGDQVGTVVSEEDLLDSEGVGEGFAS